MWHRMFVEQIPLAEKMLRTVLVYAVVAILVRLTGKRGLAGVNTLDIVVMILLSNVVQNSIIGNDLSVTGGVVGAVTLVLSDQLLNQLALRSDVFARIFDGTESVLVRDGRLLPRSLRRVGLRRADLDHAVRLQNGADVSQVDEAALEPGGQLILTLRDAEQAATKGDLAALRVQLDRLEAAVARR